MPAQVDSNSPVYWRDGQFHIINSAGAPVLSRGVNQFFAYGTQSIVVDRRDHFPMWIEAAWLDSDGTVYAWYHHEPGGVCPGSTLTAPQIGALVSFDGGRTFQDLGLILTAGDRPDCSAQNGFFASGHGDFSVILDQEQTYFYFLFGNYGGEAASQGVALARVAFEDRRNPGGTVRKYFNGSWDEPGLGGRVTPVFPVAASWQRADTNAFWGPAVHWNTYLDTYVLLLNHTCCRPKWPQEGIYISFNPDLSNPGGWSNPHKILDKAPGYYPEVLGTAPGETDTLIGQVARFYVQGRSKWEIIFNKAEPDGFAEEEPPPPDDLVIVTSAPRP